MGNNNTITEMKNLFESLVTDITKRFDEVKDNFTTLDARLTNIEQGGSKEIADATATKAKMEREAAAKELEVATKQAMEASGRAFLKEKESSTTSGILDIVDELTNKLFVVDGNKEAPYPHPSTAHGSFPVLQPRIHKMSLPTFDGKEDPLSWLNHCKQFFKGQKTQKTSKSGTPLII